MGSTILGAAGKAGGPWRASCQVPCYRHMGEQRPEAAGGQRRACRVRYGQQGVHIQMWDDVGLQS